MAAPWSPGRGVRGQASIECRPSLHGSGHTMGRTCSSGVRKLGSHLLLSRNRRQVAALRNGITGVRFTCAGQKAMSPFRALLLPCSQKQREKRLQYGG